MIRGVHVSGSLLGIAAGVLCAAPASAAPAAAGANPPAARATARLRQPDDVLVGINTSRADVTGRASSPAAAPALGWTCAFRSDTARKDFVVSFGDMGVSTGEIDMTSAKAITEDR